MGDDQREREADADPVRSSTRRRRERSQGPTLAQPGRGGPVVEREIERPVSLTLPDGRLAPEAVGFTRTPLITTDGIGRGLRGWGRNKRWEYWAVTTPTHVLAVVTSDIDYAAVHGIWLLDGATGEEISHDAIAVLGDSVRLPGTLGRGPVRTRTTAVRIAIDEPPGGTQVRARGDRVDGTEHEVPSGTSWATLDHGRGRWPYDVRWNWGAGAGTVDGLTIDLKVFASKTHQCFGHGSGMALDDGGAEVRVVDVIGWAEDVHNRW